MKGRPFESEISHKKRDENPLDVNKTYSGFDENQIEGDAKEVCFINKKNEKVIYLFIVLE